MVQVRRWPPLCVDRLAGQHGNGTPRGQPSKQIENHRCQCEGTLLQTPNIGCSGRRWPLVQGRLGKQLAMLYVEHIPPFLLIAAVLNLVFDSCFV